MSALPYTTDDAFDAPNVLPLRQRKTPMDQWLEDEHCDTRSIAVKFEYIKLLDGDFNAAGVLSQAMYYQSLISPDAWFSKSSAEWESDLGLSKYQMHRIIDKLKPFGLEVEIRSRQPSLTWHFHINQKVLQESIKSHHQRLRISPVNQRSRNFTVNGQETSPLTDEKLHHQQDRNLPVLLEEENIDHLESNRSFSSDANASLSDVADANTDLPKETSSNSSPSRRRTRASRKPKEELPVDPSETPYKVAMALRKAILDYRSDMAENDRFPKETPEDLQKWVIPLRKLINEKKADLAEIRAIIDWLPDSNKYWRSRFVNVRNNPGNILKDNFESLSEQAKPYKKNWRGLNGQHESQPIRRSTIGQAPANAQDETAYVTKTDTAAFAALKQRISQRGT